MSLDTGPLPGNKTTSSAERRMSCIFSAEGRSPRSRDAGRCSAGPPGPPPPFCSSRPEAAALRPPRPALGSSWGGGVGRGAQSRTRGECVSWAKGKSRQEINSCGRGTSTFSPKVDDLTLSLEPPSVLRRTRPYTDPLDVGCLSNMAASASSVSRAWGTGSQEGLETSDSTTSRLD